MLIECPACRHITDSSLLAKGERCPKCDGSLAFANDPNRPKSDARLLLILVMLGLLTAVGAFYLMGMFDSKGNKPTTTEASKP